MKLIAFLCVSAASTMTFAQVSGFPALEDDQTITYQKNSQQVCTRTTADVSGTVIHTGPAVDHVFDSGTFGKHCDELKSFESITYTVKYDFASSEFMCRVINRIPGVILTSAYASEWLCGIDL